VIYVYAITRDAVTPDCEAVDQSRHFGAATAGGLAAVYTPVRAEEFSQEVIDRRAGDLEWLGAIGYRHQDAIASLMRSTAVIPLRAFTLFSSEEALRAYLHENSDALGKSLDRLDGKQEWTLRVEFEPQKWSESLVGRVDSLRELQQQIESSAPGKAFLLKKKLDDERKRASAAAEKDVVAEIERHVLDKLRCETLAESRERRDGAFPQINVLINRDEEAQLQELHAELTDRYGASGVTLALTGPWPPYTFVGTMNAGG
jgi:Gas vesicle synthesis protein GvpL/GvpF